MGGTFWRTWRRRFLAKVLGLLKLEVGKYLKLESLEFRILIPINETITLLTALYISKSSQQHRVG